MDVLRHQSEVRGFFLRREALEFGVSDRVLTRGVRLGTWVRVRHGAYCHAEQWNEMDARERHLARARASYDLAKGPVALSHVSALAEYGCPLWNAPLSSCHLVRLDGASSRREAGVVHHRGRASEDGMVRREGRLVTPPTRATIEALTVMGSEAGVVAADWMVHHGLTSSAELWEVKADLDRWPGTLGHEVVLRLVDGLSASVGESRNRYLFWVMGLPRPLLQFEVRDHAGRLIAITDFAWPDRGVYGEFDGRVKYGRLLEPGQEPGDVVFAEKRREDEIRRVTGGTVVRWTWQDLHRQSAPSRQLVTLLRPAA